LSSPLAPVVAIAPLPLPLGDRHQIHGQPRLVLGHAPKPHMGTQWPPDTTAEMDLINWAVPNKVRRIVWEGLQLDHHMPWAHPATPCPKARISQME
jgi:hypothetical protein